MQIQVDYMLFKMLAESIGKMKILDQQTEEVQKLWMGLINETEAVAMRELNKFNAQNGYADGRTEVGMGPIISADKTSYL